MKLENAIALYLRNRSAQLASNSIRLYGSNLQTFSKWIGDISLKEITNDHISDFILHLRQTINEKTIQSYVSSLRPFFKYWDVRNRDECNVSYGLIRGPRVPEKFPAFITPAQFEVIDDYLDDEEYHQLTKKVIINLLWNTGMRISELLSLNVADIHPQKNYVYITTAKSKKLRLVMWNDECHELLMRYLGIRICLNNKPELFQTPPNSRYRGRRERLTTRSVQRWCRVIGKELGFRMNPHSFRHGKCHEILNNGGDRHHVQTIAGHSNITASEVYARMSLNEQSQILNRFLPQAKTPQKQLKKSIPSHWQK